MNTVQKLIQDVAIARTSYLDNISGLTEIQAGWKPDPDSWTIVEITEHLFWAEQGGILGMWKTLHAVRNGSMVRTYDSIHKDMPIEQVVDLTWQPKEKVPAVAAPRLGGTLSFWRSSLSSLQEVLSAFGEDLQDDERRLQAHPHPISGPLDFQQRIEFLRFHLNRHNGQVSDLLTKMPH
ncbi:DinB family protein [Tellurirhabdus rosea]|uniref:DinB family protein n=1 Tax=Tellurirhabdus rosea TaxID=2674997 RepID=UPI002258A667|nr:DinB family protein [Tellurirhabdus rosea]